jgi:HlyD family secretion protein
VKIVRRLFVLLLLCGVALFVFKRVSGTAAPPPIYLAEVTRGDIELTVQATGTLQATRTVDVGTQVSGVVKKMYVDYNSIVRKGDLIAEIDPQLSEAAVESAQAAVERANIDLSSAEDTLSTDARVRDREQDLFEHDLATEQNRETADLQVASDQAVVDGDKAAVVVATAGLDQAKVTLAFCTIRSPIDGVVVSRNADQGQTVAASLSVPSLYVIATDIRNLLLTGQIDEADIGKLHPGQDVTFHVDAYPRATFHGTMTQVRLNATSTSNVVTYQAIIAVRNQDLRLLPSMTATLQIHVSRAANVVRVPTAALRFRPSRDVFDALGQTPVQAPSPFNATLPRLSVPPLPLPSQVGIPTTDSDGNRVIDTKYGATPHPRARGDAWVLAAGHLRLVPLIVGISDGTWSELLEGALKPGDQLVTMVRMPTKPRVPASPFAPPSRGYGRYGR